MHPPRCHATAPSSVTCLAPASVEVSFVLPSDRQCVTAQSLQVQRLTVGARPNAIDLQPGNQIHLRHTRSPTRRGMCFRTENDAAGNLTPIAAESNSPHVSNAEAELSHEAAGAAEGCSVPPIPPIVADAIDAFGPDVRVSYRANKDCPSPACGRCGTQRRIARITLENGSAVCSNCHKTQLYRGTAECDEETQERLAIMEFDGGVPPEDAEARLTENMRRRR